MTLAGFLALVVLLVGVPLNLYVTVRLWMLHRASPEIKVLRERAIVAAVVLFTVIVFGLIFVNNDQALPLLAGEATKLITRGVLLALAIIPALYWLRLYR